MNYRTGLLLLIGSLSLLMVAPQASAAGADVDGLIGELRTPVRSVERTPQELAIAYAAILDKLVPAMGSEDWGQGGNERQALQDICWAAGRPGAEDERKAVCEAMAKRIGPETKRIARVWLIKQLERSGRGEVVGPIAAQLNAKAEEVRECARRALENSPAPEATEALTDALAKIRDVEWRAAILISLGNKGDATAASAIRPYARDKDDQTRTAALQALADLGDANAARLMSDGMNNGSERAKRAARDSYLTLAENISRSNRPLALEIYKRFLKDEGHIRCAAVVGVGRAGGADEFDTILGFLADDDVEVRGAASIALEMMPIEFLRQAIEKKLDAASPEQKIGLMRVLASRNDKSTCQTFVELAAHDDESVRVEAIKALSVVGDETAVGVLIASLSSESAEERKAARESLDRLNDKKVNRAVVRQLQKVDSDVRCQLIASLAARGATDSVKALLEAVRDPDGKVRRECLKAIGKLAGADSLPAIVQLLLKASEDADRTEAGKALVAVCKRIADVEERARPLLEGMSGAPDNARVALLGVLGKIGGEGALGAVRVELDNPVTMEPALRALMEWPDSSATSDLLRLAYVAPEPKQRILALRGYVRGVGLPSDRTPQAALSMYQKGMQAAARVEDERLVLAGIGEIGHPVVVPALSWYAKRSDLKDEVGAALVKVALAIRREHKDLAKAVLKDVIGFCEVEHILKQAKEAYNKIEEFEDYAVKWLIAGPYEQKGKTGTELFDISFPPEQEDGDVKWRMVMATGEDEPWRIDIDKVMQGDNRVCYLTAEVFSPDDRSARFELGSDDGAKVWLNGELVHAKNVSRGLNAGEDKAEIRLKSGWNPLVMKITNGSGGWQACARIRSPEGEHIEGLQYRVDAEVLGGHIGTWQLAGPYTQEGKKGTDLFDIEFPPETPQAEGVKWQKIEAGAKADAPWLVLIDRVLPGNERACYLRVDVHAPKDVDARMELGSDDGVKVWLNGELVHANNAVRGVGIAQDKANVSLKAGRNSLLMKITQGGGDWSACLRFRRPEGGVLKGLEMKLPE